jgi:hypothetical protein
MVKKAAGKAKPKTKLWRIGWWATLWWAITGLYLVWLIWLSRNTFALKQVSDSSSGFISNILDSMGNQLTHTPYLIVTLVLIVIVWIIGGVVWLIELNKNNVSYSSAFKDLFLTIRK